MKVYRKGRKREQQSKKAKATKGGQSQKGAWSAVVQGMGQ